MSAPTQLDLFGAAATSLAPPTAARKTRPSPQPRLQRAWQSALGITVGDLVRTSYHTGPYEVWRIWGPLWWETNYSGKLLYLWQSPVISLTCVRPGSTPGSREDFSYLNTIYRIGDRWLTAGCDEIIVQPCGLPGQATLAAPPWPTSWETPYRREAGVDYADRDRVFTCWTGEGPGQPGSVRCCDFNGDREVTHRSMGRVYGAARCPRCGGLVTREVWMMGLPS